MTDSLVNGRLASTAAAARSDDARSYRRCVRCVMDTTDPDISFDAAGVCSHCRSYAHAIEQLPVGEAATAFLQQTVERIKRDGRHRPYDCIIGLSGGVDSTYVALKVKQLGLRPLAVHFDSGWNSEIAVHNIEKTIKKLDIDLLTFVVDWEEMRDLQLAFLKAGVANCDIPTDHGFTAILYRTAARHGIRYIISGHNIATEWVLPKAWGHGARDLRHLREIQRRFGRKKKLARFPTISLFYDVVYCRLLKRITRFEILNYLPERYHKSAAMREIERELGWRYYGGKHYESIFTRFFQAYYLPLRFGFDKRLAHLSSLVLAGEITREDALAELQSPTLSTELLQDDKQFVLKKLGITDREFEAILQMPIHTHRDFPSDAKYISWLFQARDVLRRMRTFALVR